MQSSTLQICVILCIMKIDVVISSLTPQIGICVLATLIANTSAMPAFFYEMLDDLDDMDMKYDIFKTTNSRGVFGPPTTTTEPTSEDEWRLRGEYRVQCVEEVAVGPKKVIRLMAMIWDNRDEELKKWVLCVLNKMDLMTTEGVFKMDVAMSKIHRRDIEDAEALIDFCLPKKRMEPHEIAWEYAKCHALAKGRFPSISIF